MLKVDFENGCSITVEKADRGLEDDYKITHFVNGKKYCEEYATKECVEWEYDVKIQDEEIEETETTPEGQRPDEDLLAYIERVDQELFASLNHLAEAASILNSEQEEIPEDIRPPPY